VTAIDKEAIELKGAGNAAYRANLADLDLYDARGKKLTAEELHRRVRVGSVVAVASDENAVDPAYLSVLKEDAVVLVGVTVLTAREDKPGRGWTTDLKLMKPSDSPVVGRIFGADFKPDSIQLQNTGLDLHSGRDMIHIFLILKPGQGIEGKTYEFKADDEQAPDRPAIHCHVLFHEPAERPGVHQGVLDAAGVRQGEGWERSVQALPLPARRQKKLDRRQLHA
jgi:hypothetical protein